MPQIFQSDHIVIENTVRIPLDKRQEVADTCVNSNLFWAAGGITAKNNIALVFWDITDPGKICFDYDDGDEHFDYITKNDTVCTTIASTGVDGRILFCAMEEKTNQIKFWGVEFISGHYRKMTATAENIQWNVGTSFPGK